MFERYEHQGKVVGPRLSDVPLRVRHPGTSIRQKDSELVAGHDESPDIDFSPHKCLSEMYHVDDNEITAREELNLDSDAHSRTIHDAACHPINVACYFLGPRVGKSIIEQLADSSSTVRISLFFHLQPEIDQDRA